MQNKPNLLHTQMNVTTALTMAYRNIKPSRRLKNKPNIAAHWKSAHGGSTPHLQRTSGAAGTKSIKPVFVSSKVPKSPQKPRVSPIFSHYFSHFLSFPHVFAHFHRQSARLCRSAPQSARTCAFVSIFFWRAPRNTPKVKKKACFRPTAVTDYLPARVSTLPHRGHATLADLKFGGIFSFSPQVQVRNTN